MAPLGVSIQATKPSGKLPPDISLKAGNRGTLFVNHISWSSEKSAIYVLLAQMSVEEVFHKAVSALVRRRFPARRCQWRFNSLSLYDC